MRGEVPLSKTSTNEARSVGLQRHRPATTGVTFETFLADRMEGKDMQKCQTRSSAADAIAELAYKFWLERCFRDGSPEEDLFRAVCVNTMRVGQININSRLRQAVPEAAANEAVAAEF
jgi:hypothetical protein